MFDWNYIIKNGKMVIFFGSISTTSYEKFTREFYLMTEHLKKIEYSSYPNGFILEDIQDSMIKIQ